MTRTEQNFISTVTDEADIGADHTARPAKRSCDARGRPSRARVGGESSCHAAGLFKQELHELAAS